jgi:hypothetical protein
MMIRPVEYETVNRSGGTLFGSRKTTIGPMAVIVLSMREKCEGALAFRLMDLKLLRFVTVRKLAGVAFRNRGNGARPW